LPSAGIQDSPPPHSKETAYATSTATDRPHQ
jgi:hypothetical protein